MTLRVSLFVLGVAAAARAVAGVWLGFRPFDDTYITFRYSLNLASGHGFVYNLGEPVLGTTAPLWAMVLAIAAAAGAPIEQAALAISLACDVASAFLLFQLLRAIRFDSGIPLAGAILFLGIFDYFSLARSGMESSFFVFLVLGSLASIASRRIVVAAVFAGLAALTRPEGVLLLALFRGCLVVSPRESPQERRGNRDCRASGNRRQLGASTPRTRLDRRCRNQLLRRLLPSKIRRLRSSAGTTWGCFS